MPGEFEGDLTEAVFWGADMSGARFRDVNFTGARIGPAGGAQTATLAGEGKQKLEAISAAAAACAGVLPGDPLVPLDAGPPNAVAERVLRQVLETQRPFWPAL